MEAFINILFWLHIIALVAGGSNSVVMPIIGGKLATAEGDTRQTLFSIGDRLAKIGKVSMVVLLVTGPLMLWLRFGGVGGMNWWFWLKMALIVVMLITIVISGRALKQAEAGDASAAARGETAGKITAIAFAGVLLAAVFAFN
jgi:uncharacterized membrane protein